MPLRIPPFRLVPEPLDDEAKALAGFKWAGRGVGKRHRLGGDPEFIQEGKVPVCHECSETMTFYAQLDSINDDYCIADCGMVYVFICLQCNTVSSFIQSY